ncbi:MAG TPA: hypothetical protein VMI75_21610 [Polyangiaceae bacterium]|nr:hypothetical protein [Polyangiaceae bacterium]
MANPTLPVNPAGETFTGPNSANVTPNPAVPAPQSAVAAVISQMTIALGSATYTVYYTSGRTIAGTLTAAQQTALVGIIKALVETDQGWAPGSSTAS